MTWLRRLGMRMRMRMSGARQMRRRARSYQPRHLKIDCLPRTPPAPPPDLEPWPPRITRWIRLACPLPDDTILLSPVPAATVLEFMGRGCLWDPP